MNQNEKKILAKLKSYGIAYDLENFQQSDENGDSALMLLIQKDNPHKTILPKENWDYLLKNSNLKQQNKSGYNTFMLAILNNKKGFKKDNKWLTKDQWDYLIKNSDLKQQHRYLYNACMYALQYNQEKSLNFSRDQWDYLLKNSDLKQQDSSGLTILTTALKQYKKLNFSEDQWNYLIENSDLMQKDIADWNQFIYIIKYYRNLFSMTSNRFQECWNLLSKEEQQNTFLLISEESQYEETKFLKEDIRYLLYDMKIVISNHIKQKLLKNEILDILEMIKKRDLLFSLDKGLMPKDKGYTKKI
jgi:hypothetical protein